MKQMPWTAKLWKIARVLNERIPWFCQLPIQQERCLSGRVSAISLGRKIYREHACRRPVWRERPRPRKLHERVVAVARKFARTGGKAEHEDQRDVKAQLRAELLLDAGNKIAKIGAAVSLTEIVGRDQTQFGPRSDAEAHKSLGTIESLLGRFREPIFELHASLRHDDA